MAFAAKETAGLGQIETLMGIVPGGGGTQYLRDRVGRNRALEIVLAADLFDAETAAAYGWVNRAVPAADLPDSSTGSHTPSPRSPKASSPR